MKKALIIALGLAMLIGGTTALTAQTSLPASENAEQNFHIDRSGNIAVSNAKVMLVTGTTFYVRYYVGLAFIRLVVKTNSATKVYRRFGDQISYKEIAVGDSINFEGTIESGADTLSVIAGKVTNVSNQKTVTSFTGAITAATAGGGSGHFILTDKKGGTFVITTGTTTQIRKGNRIISPTLVRAGDRVTDATGTFDYSTDTLDANVLVLYVNQQTFAARNFEGTLKAVSTGKPPQLTFATEGADYKVILTSDTSILTKARKPVSTERFVVGDTIRIYGAVRETEEPMIDAELIRNLNL